MDREAHLTYYASATITPQDKTKPNTTKNQHASLTKNVYN